MTTKILTITNPKDCPYNKPHKTYMISAQVGGGSRLRDACPCSILSEFPSIFYCRVDIDEFPKKCPLKTYEEGEQ